MVTKETLIKNLDWITEKISSQVWTLNLGTLGTTWSLLITTTLPNNTRFTAANAIPIIIMCLLSLLCEMGQYLSAYLNDHQILKTLETNNRTEFQYETTGFLFRARSILFWCKIVLAVSASGVLVFTLAKKFI
jgi:hypothetical protein